MRRGPAVLVLLLSTGCASPPPPPLAPEPSPPPPSVVSEAPPALTPVPCPPRALPAVPGPQGKRGAKAAVTFRDCTPEELAEAAYQQARQDPTQGGWTQGRKVYTYQPGAIFVLYTALGQHTVVYLQAGEQVLDLKGADTTRWVVDRVRGAAQTYILLKPTAEGLQTSMSLFTDRRVYTLEVHSVGHTTMREVAWQYPETQTEAPLATPPQTAGCDPGQYGAAPLHTAYRLTPNRHAPVSMIPSRVLDNGWKTFVEFSPALDTGEAPALYRQTAHTALQPVAYRQQGRCYIVDGVLEQGVLRLGLDPVAEVRLQRSR